MKNISQKTMFLCAWVASATCAVVLILISYLYGVGEYTRGTYNFTLLGLVALWVWTFMSWLDLGLREHDKDWFGPVRQE